MAVVPGAPLFVALPIGEEIAIGWPTPNHFLATAPGKFFARTRVNPDYGKPGWTRDCGQRAHFGCDIAPVAVTSNNATTVVEFTDCTTGADYRSEEPTFTPHDDVFCVYDGIVRELVDDEDASEFGRHVVVEHRWPGSGARFFTLYGHLAECASASAVTRGQRLGRMGQTSMIADARNWMLVAPHLHFEVRNAAGERHDPVEFLGRFLLGGSC